MAKNTDGLAIVAAAIGVILIGSKSDEVIKKVIKKIVIMAETNFSETLAKSYIDKYNTLVLSKKFTNEANNFLIKVLANKQVYLDIQQATGVPWYFTATLHMRESGCSYARHMHNGDPLAAKTYHEPPGYPKAPPANGKFYTFLESAIDSFQYQGFNKKKDWSLAKMIYLLEVYNGKGYLSNNLINPYLWSGTQYYSTGKFIEVKQSNGKFKGVYKSNLVDAQLGAVPFLKMLLNAK